MSIILEGIDLPKDGEWLSVIIKPTKEVIVDTIRYGDYALLNTEYGSAIQIPKSHGRLIDADTKIKAELYDSENGTYIEKEMTIEQWFMFMENDAPTILEAEESR